MIATDELSVHTIAALPVQAEIDGRTLRATRIMAR
jgi:hypothetical protein